MPFTFSHPAIVLPLAWFPRWFSMTGLVIGSLMPDFEYFLRMKVQSNYSHTIAGLFWFDLPLGLLLAFVFHGIVRDSLLHNVPAILKSRLWVFTQFNWPGYFKQHLAIVIISILIGAASHIVWDSFTHEHGYFVQTISALTETVTMFREQVPVFKIMQHASTIVGGLVIAVALFRLPADNSVSGKPSLKYWSAVAGLLVAIIALRLAFGLDYKLYGNLIATCISAALISVTLVPLLIRNKYN